MKVLYLTIVLLVLNSFCLISQNDVNKDFSLEEFSVPKVSIRAIEAFNENTVWFAGSHGKYGKIQNDKLVLDSIKYQDKSPFFRAIASNGKNIFLLSIENPAILYKIDPAKENTKPEIVYTEVHDKVFYDAMTFLDAQHGIAMGDPTEDCLSVILTDDGGNTWQKVDCENIPKIIEGEAAFAASNGNLAFDGKTIWMVTGGKKARVYKSTNFGENWKVVETPMVQGGTMTGIFATDFYNANKGIIMGGDWEAKKKTQGAKALTKDGGKTWVLTANDAAPGYISSVQYVPNTKGKKLVAVSTEGIFISKDSGGSWNKISEQGYFTIRFVNENTAWLSGHQKIGKLTFNK